MLFPFKILQWLPLAIYNFSIQLDSQVDSTQTIHTLLPKSYKSLISRCLSFYFFLRIEKGCCFYCFQFLNAMCFAQIVVFFFSFLAFKSIYSNRIIIIFSQNLIIFSYFQNFFHHMFFSHYNHLFFFFKYFQLIFCFPFESRCLINCTNIDMFLQNNLGCTRNKKHS